MRLYHCILLTLFALFGMFGTLFAQSQPINLIAGDTSFEERFHRKPTATDTEELRIRTHLDYAEQQLRNTPTTHLTPAQQRNRAKALDLLHSYLLSGQFPQNTNQPGRAPCFVDERGNDCAVAHLIRKTEGDAMVEALNESYQYALIQDMESEALAQWASTNGFQPEELALIQPRYDNMVDPPPDNWYKKRKKLPMYKEGGCEGLILAFQERFPFPDSLPYDQKIKLTLVTNKKGEVDFAVISADFERHPAVAAMEGEIVTFAKGLKFSRARWQDYYLKRRGRIEIDLVFKFTEDDCSLPDTLRMFGRDHDLVADAKGYDLTGEIRDAQTGDLVESAIIACYQYPGVINSATGEYEPKLKLIGGGSAYYGWRFFINEQEHAPEANLYIYGAPDYRSLYIEKVPYHEYSLDVSLQRCIPTKDPYGYDGKPDPARMLIPITKPRE